MSNSTESKSGGIVVCCLLTVLLVGLKLTSKIDWPWWCVLSPLWLSAAFVLCVTAIAWVACELLGGR